MKNAKELEQEYGITKRTLRFYDEKGILSPTKKEMSGRKTWLYDDSKIEVLKYVLLLKELEYPLDRIKEILNYSDDELLMEIDGQIQELERKKTHIENLIQYAYTVKLIGFRTMINAVPKDIDMSFELNKERFPWTVKDLNEVEITAEKLETIERELRQICAEIEESAYQNPGSDNMQREIHKMKDILENTLGMFIPIIMFNIGMALEGGGIVAKEVLGINGDKKGACIKEAIQYFLFEDVKSKIRELSDLAHLDIKSKEVYEHFERIREELMITLVSASDPFSFIFTMEKIIEAIEEEQNNENIDIEFIRSAFNYQYAEEFKILIQLFGTTREYHKPKDANALVEILYLICNRYFKASMKLFRTVSRLRDEPVIGKWVDDIGGNGTAEYIADAVDEYCERKEKEI